MRRVGTRYGSINAKRAVGTVVRGAKMRIIFMKVDFSFMFFFIYQNEERKNATASS